VKPRAADTADAASQRAPRPLVYVSDASPGLRRLRRGKGFVYCLPDGQVLRDAEHIGRIRRLAIPPAYTQVWICPLPHGHLQATGRDARGRKQYRYHADWRSAREAGKFERLHEFGQALARIRARVRRDLAADAAAPGRAAVLAAIVRLLDTTLVRVGNDEYARLNASFGATTMHNEHATVEGSTVSLSFRGKHGKAVAARITDKRIARIVKRCQDLPGEELFGYLDETGVERDVASEDVNDYLREIAG